MIEILLQDIDTYSAWIAEYAPYILFLLFVTLAIYSIKFFREEKNIETVQVWGIDPRTDWGESREIEKEGDTAVWEIENGDDIRFKPVSQTMLKGPQGPFWILDLSDGRTLTIQESEEIIRTTGQELQKAVMDTSISQAMDVDPSDMQFYMKMMMIAAPIIIILLLVIAAAVLFGSGGN